MPIDRAAAELVEAERGDQVWLVAEGLGRLDLRVKTVERGRGPWDTELEMRGPLGRAHEVTFGRPDGRPAAYVRGPGSRERLRVFDAGESAVGREPAPDASREVRR